MKREYEKPEVDIIELDFSDIVTASDIYGVTPQEYEGDPLVGLYQNS